MKKQNVILKNVTVHNLKNIYLEFPTQELIVLSGVSGSGKSSLAFDTIYTEGQRRYIESLSNYLKKQLGGLPKPEAESIEGITPTIAIEQKSVSKNPRSTVATLTGIQDFLRIIFANISIPYCPVSKTRIKPQSTQEILQTILNQKLNSKWLILAPYAKNKKGAFKEDFKDLQKKGFLKLLVDDELIDLSEDISLDKNVHHTIDVVIDRIIIDPKSENRILDSMNQALNFMDQTFSIYSPETKEKIFFSLSAYSQKSGQSYPPLEPQDFSYNHPKGMCDYCQGLGEEMSFDLDKLIDQKKSIKEGAINHMGSYETVKWGNIYENLAEIYGFDCSTPFENLTEEQKQILLYGNNKKWTKMNFIHPVKKTSWTEFVSWKGIIHDLQTRYQEASSSGFKENMEKMMTQSTCSHCNGSRLKPYPSAARLQGRTYQEICNLSLEECLDFFNQISLSSFEQTLASSLIEEITRRLKFLLKVGLEYLNLYRSSPTLSGGEAQRIRLASQIGSGLIGTIFVLDEPSIGLHPTDNKKLIETLKSLRDLGNTIIVVEHDEETMLEADRIIDVGPKAGSLGGEILSNGSLAELLKTKNSLTGAFLRGDFGIEIPLKRRIAKDFLQIKGASYHNLKGIDVSFPLECLVAITGVSGSGKSSLILGTLTPALSNILSKTDHFVGSYKELIGSEKIKKIIAIDQSPIGRTPRSNPATYVKIFDEIRELYASTKEAKTMGFQAGRFSFNVKEGSCPQCLGMGILKMDMDFMEEEVITCPQCLGKRFDPQTLSILYKEKSIYDVLEMSISDAKNFFSNISHLEKKLSLLEHVGLGYMKLGQSSTTLSGGEAQRIKLAKELIRPSNGQTLYILDEPTTGLHFADIERLLSILQQLIERKNSVIVIEHNMDLIKTADYIIDLGPKGGENGGLLLGAGTPEEIAKTNTLTGIALKESLEIDRKKRTKKILELENKKTNIEPISQITITGAKEHNLKNLSLTIPRNKITTFTGPSGSGKSSLAFDTIYAEGQRRYVESLSSYIRQFISVCPKPQVDWIDGLSPAIALDQGKILKNPRSTIGTMTEAYDYLRILFAKEGIAYCPETGEEIRPIHIDFVYKKLFDEMNNQKIVILAPIKIQPSFDFINFKKELQKLGFIRIKLNDEYFEIDDEIAFHPKKKNNLKIVIDRLVVKLSDKKRILDSLEKAKEVGLNEIFIDCDGKEHYFHLAFAAIKSGKSYPLITPKSFLFNAADGMCLDCLGLGFQYGSFSFIKDNFLEMTPLDILFYFLKENATKSVLRHFIKSFNELDIDTDLPLSLMPFNMLEKFLKGSPNQKSSLNWIGLENTINRIAKSGPKEIKEFFHNNLSEITCNSCNGSRLNPLSSNVRLKNFTMQEVVNFSVDELLIKIESFSYTDSSTIEEVILQLKKRLKFLKEIGLGYLSLERKAPTLSGGELQRIRLSKQLGASLSGCLYVLDEPTIGLHPHNNSLLNQALINLKELGNTILLVEHDPMTIKISDYIVDFGPEAGKNGGYILAEGSYEDIYKNAKSITGQYLSGKIKLPSIVHSSKDKNYIYFTKAKFNNLKNISFSIPTGKLTTITGVSGSGKSTLLYDIIYKNILEKTSQKNPCFQFIEKVTGLEKIEKVFLMEQGALGQTSRSDISTYTDLLSSLRTFMSSLPEAKTRGLQPKNFSFNHPKGMCKTCEGLGSKFIDLKFLSPIKVPCPDCLGYRLNPLSLKVEYKGFHLGKLLNLSVEELLEFLPPIPKAVKILNSLKNVGLGYISLSQEINTLSGGEAQRLKLSKELTKQSTQKTIFLLDEPSTGLHYKDLSLLISVIDSLLKKGCTIVMVEHNLDLINLSHHIIDLGPDAGINGGEIIFEGTPKDLKTNKKSYTGYYLKMHSCGIV